MSTGNSAGAFAGLRPDEAAQKYLDSLPMPGSLYAPGHPARIVHDLLDERGEAEDRWDFEPLVEMDAEVIQCGVAEQIEALDGHIAIAANDDAEQPPQQRLDALLEGLRNVRSSLQALAQ